MYSDDKMRDGIIKSILSFMHNGAVFKTTNSYIDEDGIDNEIVTNYTLHLGMKKETYITGVVYKETRVLCKRVEGDKIITYTVPTIEDVKFYFDVVHEIVGFHTRIRFGFQEFNRAFSGILNQCMEDNKSELRFEASLYNEGMNIKEITSELKKISNIKKLQFNFRIPNPSDDNMREDLGKKLTDLTEDM